MTKLQNWKTLVNNLNLKKAKPSDNNRLLQYLKITDSDCFIAEYVDFLTFYWSFLPETLVLWTRDNDAWTNFFGFHIARWNEGTGRKNIILKIIYYYEGKLVDIGQLNEFSKDWQRLLRVQIYGKGLLILNREDLRSSFEDLLKFFGMKELTLTRIDYAIDCEKINFKKKNTLNAKKGWSIYSVRTGKIEYIGFGSKWVSPLYIRYYNKKVDLKETNYERLYPDYDEYPQIMRYELQVNSDGIAPVDKNATVDQIKNIASFNSRVSPRKRVTQKKECSADRDFEKIKEIVFNYKKTNNQTQLLKIKMLLTQCWL